MKEELYFCLCLTENEHYIVKEELQELCNKFNLQLKYYRELKEGHIPTYREVKIIGKDINKIKKYIKESDVSVCKNPHKDNEYCINLIGKK